MQADFSPLDVIYTTPLISTTQTPTAVFNLIERIEAIAGAQVHHGKRILGLNKILRAIKRPPTKLLQCDPKYLPTKPTEDHEGLSGLSGESEPEAGHDKSCYELAAHVQDRILVSAHQQLMQQSESAQAGFQKVAEYLTHAMATPSVKNNGGDALVKSLQNFRASTKESWEHLLIARVNLHRKEDQLNHRLQDLQALLRKTQDAITDETLVSLGETYILEQSFRAAKRNATIAETQFASMVLFMTVSLTIFVARSFIEDVAVPLNSAVAEMISYMQSMQIQLRQRNDLINTLTLRGEVWLESLAQRRDEECNESSELTISQWDNNRCKRQRHVLKRLRNYLQLEGTMLQEAVASVCPFLSPWDPSSHRPDLIPAPLTTLDEVFCNVFRILSKLAWKKSVSPEGEGLNSLLLAQAQARKTLMKRLAEAPDSGGSNDGSEFFSDDLHPEAVQTKAVLDYEVQLCEVFIQWFHVWKSTDLDIAELDDSVLRLVKCRQELSVLGPSQVARKLWAAVVPGHEVFLKHLFLEELLGSFAGVQRVPPSLPAGTVREKVVAALQALVPPPSQPVSFCPLETHRSRTVRNFVHQRKATAVVATSDIADLPVGSEVDVLIPYSDNWLIRFRDNIFVLAPSCLHRLSRSSFPPVQEPKEALGCPSASPLDRAVSILSPLFAPRDDAQTLPSIAGKLKQTVQEIIDSDLWTSELVLDQTTSSATAVDQHFDQGFPGVDITTVRRGGLGSQNSSRAQQSSTNQPDSSPRRSELVESVSAHTLDEIDKGQPARFMAARPDSSDGEPVWGIARTSTSVTNFGKTRPSTLEDEFSWRFQYTNPKCRVLQQCLCALSGRILLQGKLYITTTAIGFYSAFNDATVFSSIPTLVLFELSDIVDMKKRAYALIFQNAIEFTLKDQSTFFFTSFLRRDKAWQLLMVLTAGRFEEPSAMPPGNQRLSARVRSILDSIEEPSDGEDAPSKSPTATFVHNQTPQPHFACPDGEGENEYGKGFPKGPLRYNIPGLLIKGRTLEDLTKTLFLNMNFLKIYLDRAGCRNFTSDPIPDMDLEALRHSRCSRLSRWEKPIKRTAGAALLRLPEFAKLEEVVELKAYPDHDCVVQTGRFRLEGVPMSDYFFVINCTRLTKIGPDEVQLDQEMDLIWERFSLLKGKVESTSVEEWKGECSLQRTVLQELITDEVTDKKSPSSLLKFESTTTRAGGGISTPTNGDTFVGLVHKTKAQLEKSSSVSASTIVKVMVRMTEFLVFLMMLRIIQDLRKELQGINETLAHISSCSTSSTLYPV